MSNIKNKRGITTISLIIMIIVIMIIAGISLFYGTDMVDKLKLEGVQTNLISIRAKAKGIAEEVNAKIWTSNDKNSERRALYSNDYNMIFVTEEPLGVEQTELKNVEHECYEITKETLEKMSLENIYDENNKYYVIYSSDDYTKLDVLYGYGIEYGGTTYYSLSKMQESLGIE